MGGAWSCEKIVHCGDGIFRSFVIRFLFIRCTYRYIEEKTISLSVSKWDLYMQIDQRGRSWEGMSPRRSAPGGACHPEGPLREGHVTTETRSRSEKNVADAKLVKNLAKRRRSPSKNGFPYVTCPSLRYVVGWL